MLHGRVLQDENEEGGEHEQDERTCEFSRCCSGRECLPLLRRRGRVVPETTTGNAVSDRGGGDKAARPALLHRLVDGGGSEG